jgi:hypothetical protein
MDRPIHIEKLTRLEKSMLEHLRSNPPIGCSLDVTIENERLYIHVTKSDSRHPIDVFSEDELMVLCIGEWTHDHPETLAELSDIIDRVVKDKVIIWKVTRPNGYEYSGHYDIDDWKANPEWVDEPDSYIEPGDRLQKETFTKLIEDRIIE